MTLFWYSRMDEESSSPLAESINLVTAFETFSLSSSAVKASKRFEEACRNRLLMRLKLRRKAP